MDPFATLGLPRRYEIDLQQLERRYRELQRALHPDKHVGATASQRRMSMLKAIEVNDAYRALKDELRRAEALLALHDAGRRAGEQPEDPEFLLEMLELREALAEAKEHNDAQRMEQLRTKVEQLQAAARDALGTAFDGLGVPPSAEQLENISKMIGRLKYFRRFLDEVHDGSEREID